MFRILIILHSFYFVSVFADTPVNCTYDDVVGIWKFTEGPRGHKSHLQCNTFITGDESHVTTFELLFPDLATDHFGNVGKWTIIYNQGFEVVVNYRKYFAFSDWVKMEHSVKSLCHQTKPGWSHDIYARDWSCFVGKKVDNRKLVKKSANDRLEMNKFASLPFKNDRKLIEAINEAGLSWKATEYERLERMTNAEVHRMVGGSGSRILSRPSPSIITSAQKMAARNLPVEFDWKNKSGVNFISDVRYQGICGSCYAFASMAMLEARYRILTNNSMQPVFSPQDVVECSQYSQGCDGGFPYLIAGKYGEDFGVVSESCNPYKMIPSNLTKCSTSPDCRRYFTTGYEYVGGYYGATNEVLMKIELIEHGPIAVGVEVYDDFVQYKSGIYHHIDLSNRKTDRWDPFQLTNHAVLVVGYGIDRSHGQPYWIVKNSWGADWGENGYFRIRRGTDECGIESLAVKATPIPTY